MRVSPAGRGIPGGGIISRRSFVMTFSARVRSSSARETSKPWRERFPVWSWSLWQVMQTRWTTSVRASSGIRGSSASERRLPTPHAVAWPDRTEA
jgi:hypothetical protein